MSDRAEFYLEPSTCTLFVADFDQALFWKAFDCKCFLENQNGIYSHYWQSPHWFNLRNYALICTRSRMSFNSFSGAPSFLCFLTVDFPVRNLALSTFNWHPYSCITCSVYVELIYWRTFARSITSASLRFFYSIFIHFPESGFYLWGFFSTLISRGIIYSMVPPTLCTPWSKWCFPETSR